MGISPVHKVPHFVESFFYFSPPLLLNESVLPCRGREEVKVNPCGIHLPGINVPAMVCHAIVWMSFASLLDCSPPLISCH